MWRLVAHLLSTKILHSVDFYLGWSTHSTIVYDFLIKCRRIIYNIKLGSYRFYEVHRVKGRNMTFYLSPTKRRLTNPDEGIHISTPPPPHPIQFEKGRFSFWFFFLNWQASVFYSKLFRSCIWISGSWTLQHSQKI